MKKMNLIESGPPLSADEIERFEALTGVTLPTDYSAFLQVNNGGFPVPAVSGIAEAQIEITVNEFYRFTRIAEESEPELGLIEIGADTGSQEILLITRGNRAGEVLLLIDGEPHTVAGSFSAFLDLLKPDADHAEALNNPPTSIPLVWGKDRQGDVPASLTDRPFIDTVGGE